MNPNEIEELVALLDQLREADKDFRVFGAEEHQYELKPTLTETELQDFERKHQIKLPQDYRCFLKEIAGSGAGPYYGLTPLEEVAESKDLSMPFPFTHGYSEDETIRGACMEEVNSWDGYVTPGLLDICHLGCGYQNCLVVNGPAYGAVWEMGEWYYSTGLTFSIWYRRWLERALLTLKNDALVDKIKIGMSTEDILSTVGGDWKESKTSPDTGDRYFFIAPCIPVGLELDSAGKVIHIERWDSILAKSWDWR